MSKTILIGAFIQTFEVSTLGQPFEVLKTHMAANRNDNLRTAIKKTYQRGGVKGFYQGLIPWAWIEASTKGGVLLFTLSKVEKLLEGKMSSSLAGVLGGMSGGIMQAYTTMGICTFMKTVEVTRHKSASHPSTFQVAMEVFKKHGIKGLNRGVNAVALRQMTNWGSRLGISRFLESIFGKSQKEKILSSCIGGTLACWNQPLEVIRVEMQSMLSLKKVGIWETTKHIYNQNGLLGFYRGVTPRICLSVYLTVCMVFGGDKIKQMFN